MQPVHANHHHTAHAAQAGRPAQSAESHRSHSGSETGTARPAIVDEIDLSPAARQFVEQAGRGRSAASPAHVARQQVSENEGLAKLPFGRVVSAINHDALETLIAENTLAAPAEESVEPAPAETGTRTVTAGDATVGTELPATETPAEGDSAGVQPEATADASGETPPSGDEPASSIVPADGAFDPTASLIEALEDDDASSGQTAA
jgi:hypothetical protein